MKNKFWCVGKVQVNLASIFVDNNKLTVTVALRQWTIIDIYPR